MVKLTVVVNNLAKRGLRSAWGLSILVEGDKRIMFDTGPDSGVLKYNIEKLNMKGELDHLIISHNHWDHIGGIKYANVYAKSLCVPEKIEYVKGNICEHSTKIDNMGLTTGIMGNSIREQGLVVFGDAKTALVVGCSHPGIENMVKRAYELAGHIDIVIGGFHLLNTSMQRLEKIVNVFKNLDVQELYGIHCTGSMAQDYFKIKLGERAKDGYAGLSLEF